MDINLCEKQFHRPRWIDVVVKHQFLEDLTELIKVPFYFFGPISGVVDDELVKY